MTGDQSQLFILLICVFGFLVWGRFRYDLVAFTALLVALVLELVPSEDAFSGFGHPATIVVALVLIVSKGLFNSGAVEIIVNLITGAVRRLTKKFPNRETESHITLMSISAAALSAFMNNVAALAVLMPADVQAATKAKRSPSLSLMPLSFASILGGMITLIGTPPNIIVAEIRGSQSGVEPFGMFDFASVGLWCALSGILFLILFGTKIIPKRKGGMASSDQFNLANYIAELKVPEGSVIEGRRVRDLDTEVKANNIEILGLYRKGKRLPGFARREEIRAEDVLVIDGAPADIESTVGELELEYVGAGDELQKEDRLELLEVVVAAGGASGGGRATPLAGSSAKKKDLLQRHHVSLVGVSRGGVRFRKKLRELTIRVGDVLLLLGSEGRLNRVLEIDKWSLLPLRDRGHRLLQRNWAWASVLSFATFILIASLGILGLPIALGIVAAIYVFFDWVSIERVYDAIEWPIIVLLGCMIPIGAALQDTGGTTLIANALLTLSAEFGQSPRLALALLVLVTMTLSDVMNNAATAVIAAPLAIEIADKLNLSADPFLMGVAVAASCAFLTPIGHQNNTLIMGPGGYRFGDYWRLGLPLEILVVCVAVALIPYYWPF